MELCALNQFFGFPRRAASASGPFGVSRPLRLAHQAATLTWNAAEAAVFPAPRALERYSASSASVVGSVPSAYRSRGEVNMASWQA